MHEVLVTVVGNAVTQIAIETSEPGVPIARFRLAGTVRQFDRARGGWTDAHTSLYTVWAKGTLARNLAASVTVGEPLIVRGELRVRESKQGGQVRGGQGRGGHGLASVDVIARAVGHDLSCGTSAFARVSRATPGLTPDGSGVGRGRGARPGAVPSEHSGSRSGPGAGPGSGAGRSAGVTGKSEARVPNRLPPSRRSQSAGFRG